MAAGNLRETQIMSQFVLLAAPAALDRSHGWKAVVVGIAFEKPRSGERLCRRYAARATLCRSTTA